MQTSIGYILALKQEAAIHAELFSNKLQHTAQTDSFFHTFIWKPHVVDMRFFLKYWAAAFQNDAFFVFFFFSLFFVCLFGLGFFVSPWHHLTSLNTYLIKSSSWATNYIQVLSQLYWQRCNMDNEHCIRIDYTKSLLLLLSGWE